MTRSIYPNWNKALLTQPRPTANARASPTQRGANSAWSRLCSSGLVSPVRADRCGCPGPAHLLLAALRVSPSRRASWHGQRSITRIESPPPLAFERAAPAPGGRCCRAGTLGELTRGERSEEHTSETQSTIRLSYAAL